MLRIVLILGFFLGIIKVNAQQVIYTTSGDTISCAIYNIEQHFISFSSRQKRTLDSIPQNRIKGISTFLLDADFYRKNFSLQSPYTVTGLFLKDKLTFIEGYSFKNQAYRSIQSKILSVKADTLTFLYYSDGRYDVHQIATSNLKDFNRKELIKSNLSLKDKDVLILQSDSSKIGSILSWENNGITIMVLDTLLKVPLADIAYLQLANGDVYLPADDILVPKLVKQYPRISIAIGSGFTGSINSSGTEPPSSYSPFLNGRKTELNKLNSFLIKSQISLSEHIDIQLRLTSLRSNAIIFSGSKSDYAIRQIPENTSIWSTTYVMKANIYELGVGYSRNKLRLGAALNVTNTKSEFDWNQVSYVGFVGNNNKSVKGVRGVIVSRPHLGYSLGASYKFSIGRKFFIEPEVRYTSFNIDFDRLMNVFTVDNKPKYGQHWASVGDYSEFRSYYGDNQTNWNVVSFNIFISRRLFKF